MNDLLAGVIDAQGGVNALLDFVIERHGGIGRVAHYTSEHQDFSGLIVPTRRRVLIRNDEDVADQSFCAILLDVSEVRSLGRRIEPECAVEATLTEG